jgi:Holliday junction resolvase RusA-like endonuclease
VKQIFETFVTMEPTAKGRPRTTRTGHTYTPTKTIQAEHRVQEQVGREWPNPPLDVPLRFELTAYLPRPKSPKNKKFPVTRLAESRNVDR